MTAGQPRGVLTWENYFRGEPQQPNDAREGVVMDWRRGRLTPKAHDTGTDRPAIGVRIARVAVNENRNGTPNSQLAFQLALRCFDSKLKKA